MNPIKDEQTYLRDVIHAAMKCSLLFKRAYGAECEIFRNTKNFNYEDGNGNIYSGLYIAGDLLLYNSKDCIRVSSTEVKEK